MGQLTGEWERGPAETRPAMNAAECRRVGLEGTDLGISFFDGSRIWFLFGDTWPNRTRVDGSLSDCVAWTTDLEPGDVPRLHFVGDNHWRPPTFTGGNVTTGVFEVPTGGFATDEGVYVFFATDHTDREVMGRSVLGRAREMPLISGLYDPTALKHVYDVSVLANGGRFINIAPCVVRGGIPGLPFGGDAVMMWGSGRYRESNVFLAVVPLRSAEVRGSWWYLTGVQGGSPAWSHEESEAQPLFDHPQVGELSVAWIDPLRRWLMTYNAMQPAGIVFRTSPTPWGPWSDPPHLLYDSHGPIGYGRTMHIGWHDGKGTDYLYDRGRGEEGGGAYGGYIVDRYTRRVDNNTAEVFFALSTWNPYQVSLMAAQLRVHHDIRDEVLLPPSHWSEVVAVHSGNDWREARLRMRFSAEERVRLEVESFAPTQASVLTLGGLWEHTVSGFGGLSESMDTAAGTASGASTGSVVSGIHDVGAVPQVESAVLRDQEDLNVASGVDAIDDPAKSEAAALGPITTNDLVSDIGHIDGHPEAEVHVLGPRFKHPERAVGPPALFQSTFGVRRRNWELAVARAGSGFYFRACNNDGDQPNWGSVATVPEGGPFLPALILDALALTQSPVPDIAGGVDVWQRRMDRIVLAGVVGDEVVYMWRDRAAPWPWKGPFPVIAVEQDDRRFPLRGVRGNPVLIRSTFGDRRKNFELVVPDDRAGVRHMWMDHDLVFPLTPDWRLAPTFAAEAGSVDAVTMIQSSFLDGDRGHLEVVMRKDHTLLFCWRGSAGWSESLPIVADGAPIVDASGYPCLLQSRFGAKRRNFELLTPLTGGGIGAFWLDNDPEHPDARRWHGPVIVDRNTDYLGVVVVQGPFGQDGRNLEVAATTSDGRVVHIRRDAVTLQWGSPIELLPPSV